ncbi:hypothetical protein PG996_010318 [Apiospora saccharicola]|uniref:Ecp2 effector protein-like domain-containing protein n=1 Tax=Apiospora saccharicola TaxID=335842 RepID=A0ABR1UN85_9PEZI
MQLIIHLVAHLVWAAAVLGAALPAVLPVKPGFTSHEITKADGSKDVLYLRSGFVLADDTDDTGVGTGHSILAGQDPAPPANVPFTATDSPVANCPIDMSSMDTDTNSVPAATLADCQALQSAMDTKSGFWNQTNWHAMYTLASVGTCKFSAFRWDGADLELKVGNLDIWAYLERAAEDHVSNGQIQVYGNGPCGGANDTEIRFDIGNTKH